MQHSSTILFVDSDTNQLESLRRSLRDYRRQWRLLFSEDVDSALAAMQREPVDILVCETLLDNGKGTQLLKQAQESHPLATRLLFSGQTMREPAQELVQHAHQFIAKPCPLETLVATLQRVLRLRELLHNTAMREMINSLSTLPSLPSLYCQLIEALRSESASVHDIGLLVEQDMAMSAKLLQMVNSAFFGLPQHIASPAHAVSLLGKETVTNLALTAGLFAQLKPSLVDAFDLESLWLHSLRVAGLTRKLSAEMPDAEPTEIPVLAGLLHDLGTLVFISADSEEYRRVMTLADEQGIPLDLAEAETLWADHAAIGAYLMGLWGLPYAAVEAVALHHKPALINIEQTSSLLVYAANLLIHNLSDSRHSDDYNTENLVELVGADLVARWMVITREFLDGETA